MALASRAVAFPSTPKSRAGTEDSVTFTTRDRATCGEAGK
jgi:hypothetical protein